MEPGEMGIQRDLSRVQIRNELDRMIEERVRRRVEEIDEAWPWRTEHLR